MFFFGIISLAMPLIGLTLLAWAVLTIWRAVTLPRKTPREPVCEQCKYPVVGHVGVAGFTCPECGSDLLHVGIATPRMEANRRGSLTTAIMAWTFLFTIGGYIAAMFAYMLVGFTSVMSTTAMSTTTWTQSLIPNTNVYDSIDLVYDSDWQSIVGVMEIELTLSDGSQHALSLDPIPLTVVGLKDGQSTWDDETVAVWFAEIGLDVTDPEVAAAASEASRVVYLTLMSPDSGYSLNLTQHANSFGSTATGVTLATSNGATFVESRGFWLFMLAIAVLIYALGIMLIVRRRRRLLRHFTSLSPPPDSQPSPT